MAITTVSSGRIWRDMLDWFSKEATKEEKLTLKVDKAQFVCYNTINLKG